MNCGGNTKDTNNGDLSDIGRGDITPTSSNAPLTMIYEKILLR